MLVSLLLLLLLVLLVFLCPRSLIVVTTNAPIFSACDHGRYIPTIPYDCMTSPTSIRNPFVGLHPDETRACRILGAGNLPKCSGANALIVLALLGQHLGQQGVKLFGSNPRAPCL